MKGDTVTIRIAALPARDGEVPEPEGDPAERAQIAAYLAAGTPILATTGTSADRYDPELGTPVPLTVRSDGTWAWSDAIGYYLRTYGVLPEPDLVAHIRAAGYRCPTLSIAGADAALTAFLAARAG